MAQSIEEALVAFLGSDSGIIALINPTAQWTGIYPEEAPQNAPWPHICYQVIDYPQDAYLAGPSGVVHPRITLTCWAKGLTGRADVRALSDAVRNARGPGGPKLNGYSGWMGQVHIQRCLLDNRRFSSEPPIHADEQPFRRCDLDFIIVFDEAP